MKNFKPRTYVFILTFLLLLLNCNQKNSPYIVVGGDKVTVDELKSKAPEQYNRIESEYNSKLISLLNEVAVQKMLDKEAAEKKTDVKTYIQDFYNKVPTPTVTEINTVYKNLQSSGSMPKGNPAELQMQIVEYLKREKANELIHDEIGKLKKKYAFKVVDGREIKKAEVDIKGEPFRGNPNAKVVIIEFSDYECPFCQKAQKVTTQLREKYGDKIKWVFKDFPLEFHQNAMAAHLAGNCVFREKPDQFWKFFDIIFAENRAQDTLSMNNLEKLAVSLGVNQSSFQLCMKDEAIKNKIKENISQGSKLGVNGTPAFFINGRMLSGAQPISEFEAIISEEI